MFFIHSVEGGYVPSFEYHNFYDVTPKIGMAMTYGANYLIACGAEYKPEYICMGEFPDGVTSGEVPVIKVSENIIFETETEGELLGVCLGGMYKLSDDSMTVVAEDGGHARLINQDGETVRVRFE
ncbi:MAG: hypothetical protein IJZ20_06085 [Clostridia bacterium]|nr:hypothetical protein [Clostridia bacterium]